MSRDPVIAPDSGPSAERPIAAVLLAAGASTRLGVNKLLVRVAGEPLVRRAARQALAARLAPVLVVLGHERATIAAVLADLPVTLVENPDHAVGMPSSFRAGIAAVPAGCAAAVVLLPDMPLVGATMVRQVVERFRESGAPLVTSLYGTTPAPPTLYARALFPAALAARDGGRQVVREHRDEAAVVRHPADLLVDVDLPEDLELLRRFAPEE